MRATRRHVTLDRRGRAWTALLGAFLCACLPVQHLFVPLHLLLHEHLPAGAPSERGPALVAAFDDHSHEGHRPHPVEDHVAEAMEPAALPTFVATAIAPAPDALPDVADPAPRERVHWIERGSRPPPFARTAPPRAPPISA